jgi:hypothetical protein
MLIIFFILKENYFLVQGNEWLKIVHQTCTVFLFDQCIVSELDNVTVSELIEPQFLFRYH